jgi:enoyl-CoA hydratase/carnithine racemase
MTSADRPHARVERHGRRGELVLDREDRTNAMGLRMIRELTAGLRELLADDNIGAIVVRGEGDVLCIGMDLHAELLDSHKPIVAALCGPAYGGAAALALSCDFLIAAEDAQINLPEVRLSMVAWMNAAVITRRFGSSQALTLALSARDHSADDLLRLKMATAVFPRDEVVEAARARADELASHDPQSLAATKRLVHELAGFESAADALRKAAALAAVERTVR